MGSTNQPAGHRYGSVSLRQVHPNDEEFLFEVYASTTALDPLLTRIQYRALLASRQISFPDCERLVILAENEPAGYLNLLRAPSHFHIVDLVLLPEFRNHGVGTSVLNEVITQAERLSVPVHLSVERSNPAKRLYERLGFRVTGESREGFHLEMVRA
ncbi:MAG TPA: GNAT family N-acetyltransferase [Bryobacteraceae bacterium]|nr:GNAT family N-acetyltransferase [Bryobacteraceae bacterium]